MVNIRYLGDGLKFETGYCTQCCGRSLQCGCCQYLSFRGGANGIQEESVVGGVNILGLVNKCDLEEGLKV